GHQPIHNEGKTTWIVFNGEIYNFPELRERLQDTGHRFYTHTDTEVIVHAYDEWGEGCVERLNGVFAFAIWDSRRGRLFLARDRLGVKPLYYALTSVRLECVRKELIADVPLGVFLSGGIDSSTVTAMMTRLLPGKVHSFSIGFTDRSFDESGYAREVAAHLGTNHHEMIFETSMLTD